MNIYGQRKGTSKAFYACNQLWDEVGCDIQTTKTKIAGEWENGHTTVIFSDICDCLRCLKKTQNCRKIHSFIVSYGRAPTLDGKSWIRHCKIIIITPPGTDKCLCDVTSIWSNPTKWTHVGVLSATVGVSLLHYF